MPSDHRRGELRFIALVLSGLFAACGEGAPAPAAEEAGGWRVAAEPSAVIGGRDERPGYLLDRVVGATRLSDGRIVVLDGGSSELLFYDDDGTFLKRAGGAGDGPGELRGAFQLQRLPGDTLMVLSFRPGLTWFSPEGAVVRSETFDIRGMASLPCRFAEGNQYVLPDASFLFVLSDNFGGRGCPPSPEEPWRMTGLIARAQTPGGPLDTLAILPATERNGSNFRVYGRELTVALGDDRIWASDTGGDEILVLGFGGDTLATLPVPFAARPVPTEARTTDVRRWQRPDGTEEVGQAYAYPGTYPRVGRILPDQEGMLWVMAYPTLTEPTGSYPLFRAFVALVDPAGAEWRVLDPEGAVVAEVRTPPGFFPLEIGEDYLLGLEKDELDVQSVVRYALMR